jgi:DNA-binding PadR family transcriptional regulator
MRGESLKGHLDLLILSVLKERSQHGYAVIEALRRGSGGVFDLPEGTIYPALHRLEQGGLLASQWSDYEGRRRRVYKLTRSGHAALSCNIEEWARFTGAVAALLKGFA